MSLIYLSRSSLKLILNSSESRGWRAELENCLALDGFLDETILFWLDALGKPVIKGLFREVRNVPPMVSVGGDSVVFAI